MACRQPKPGRPHFRLAPADKVNNLNPVAFRQDGRCPVSAARDILVSLNCDSGRRKREALDQIFETRSVRYFLSFSV